MSNAERRAVEAIRAQYEKKEKSKVKQLLELDRKVKRPAEIFAYTFGTIGSLVLGVGMCLAMKVLGDMMIFGIVIGIMGIAAVSANYFIYKKTLQSNKAKYADRILALSNEILQTNE